MKFVLRISKIMFIIIINKTSSTGPSGKEKVVYKLLSQPHKNLRHGKLKKPQLWEVTNGLTQPVNSSSVLVSDTVKGRSFHSQT